MTTLALRACNEIYTNLKFMHNIILPFRQTHECFEGFLKFSMSVATDIKPKKWQQSIQK